MKPDVGKQAMLSALGDIPPFWGGSVPGSARGGAGDVGKPPQGLADALPAKGSTKPYHVGRMRARGQLFTALDTKNEQAQLRRLEQALDTPAARYDPDLKQIGAFAGRQADTLSNRLRTPIAYVEYTPPQAATSEPAAAVVEQQVVVETSADAEAPEGEDADTAAAAVRIQSRYRGGKDRQAVEAKKQQKKEEAEQTIAATRIQSIHRGNTARKKTQPMGADNDGEEQA